MRLAVKLTTYLLTKANLSLEERNALVIHILDKLGALPIRDIIKIENDGSLLINGRKLTAEEIMSLRESAKGVLNSQARQAIHNQVAFKAVSLGVHKVENPEQMFFARAALWYGQQEDEFLKLLAGEQEPDLIQD